MYSIKQTVSTLLLLTGAASLLQAAPTTYEIDAVHSGISFKIRHLVGQVPGSFADFKGEVVFDPEHPENSSTMATIEVKSIDTGNDRRDGHLRNEDFFNVEKFPTITFKSTSWKETGEHEYEVTGDLTILDNTHPVTLDVTYFGEAEGRNGTKLGGWEGTTTINRTDFGIHDPSGVTLGDKVQITIDIQAAAKEEHHEEHMEKH